MEKITQPLAGRTMIAKLLPFSRKEIFAGDPDRLSETTLKPDDINTLMFTGSTAILKSFRGGISSALLLITAE